MYECERKKCLWLLIKMTSAYIAAHLGHLERVQSLGVAHVDPHCLFLVLHVGLFVFNLKHMPLWLNYHIYLGFCSDISSVSLRLYLLAAEKSVRLLTSLARSREALAALTLRSSTPMSQALDLVFSHSSLYLIWSDTFQWSNDHFEEWQVIFCDHVNERVHAYEGKRLCVDLHHCTRRHWLWPFWFGAGPEIVCTDVWSFHSPLCNLAKRHINNTFKLYSRLSACKYSMQLKSVDKVGVIIINPWLCMLSLCSLLTLLTRLAFFLAKMISGVSVTGLYLTWSMCCL